MVTVAAMVLGSLNMRSYLRAVLGTPVLVWLGIFLAAGIIFAAGVLLFRALVLRGAVWSGLRRTIHPFGYIALRTIPILPVL